MIYAFGPYRLDTDRVELWRGDDPVALESQVFSVLLHLIENRDRVVSKDDLIDAVWQGRAISDAALSTRINGARRAVGDNGTDQAVIRTVRRRGFRFVAEVNEETAAAEDDLPPVHEGPAGDESSAWAAGTTINETALALPDKPSIAVLPFANLSGDADQDYFSDGVTEDIITALSNIRSFFVIARNSSFTYKGRAVDAKTVGRELGVHYVLEGSVRIAGERVRVSAALVEAETAVQVWADRFEGTLDDIFDLQDSISASVVGAIEPEMVRVEAARIKLKRPDNLDAYDHTLRGLARMNRLTEADTAEAQRLFLKAGEMDPRFGRAWACASWCYRRKVQLQGMVLNPKERRDGLDLADRAMATDPTDPYILWQAGLTYALLNAEHDRAMRLIERSLSINVNSTRCWLAAAIVHNILGQPEKAIEEAERGVRLSPLETAMWVAHCELAIANFQLARYDEAADWGRQSVEKFHDNLPAHHMLITGLSALGRAEEARRRLERLLEIAPGSSIAEVRDVFPVSRYRNLDKLMEVLRAAGMPDA